MLIYPVQSQGDIAAQYKEVMNKVHTLNVISDSNHLLRDERDQLTKQVCVNNMDYMRGKDVNVSLGANLRTALPITGR